MEKGYPELEVMRNNIQAFKKKHKLTNQDVARDLDVSTSHISRVLNGETIPSLQFLSELSRYMGVTLASLFIDSDEQVSRTPHSVDVNVILRALFSEMGLSTGKVAQVIEYIANLDDSRN